MKHFEIICKKTQKELKRYLRSWLKLHGYTVTVEDGFIYAKGNIPVLLTAHLDTVHKNKCGKILTDKDGCLYSENGIGGDDRCGVYIILKLIERGYKPSVLFCEDEEIGGIGSNLFVKSKHLESIFDNKYIVELDRANKDDLVFYECGNEEFKQYITKVTGYKEAYGSFSDICNISPYCDLASVNISCGYYNAHTKKEYVVFSEMKKTINVVKALLKDSENCEQFDYQEITYNSFYGYNNGFYGYDYHDWYDYSYAKNTTDKKEKSTIQIMYVDKDGNEKIKEYNDCSNIYEGLGKFFKDNYDICYQQVIDFDYYTE